MSASQWVFATSSIVGIAWFLLGTWPIFRHWRMKGRKFICPDKNLHNWLIQQLSRIKHTIVIASDDLREEVFSQECITTLRGVLANNGNINIRVLLGPDMSNKENPLAGLTDQIRFTEKSLVQNFCVIDGIHLVVELPHAPSYKRWEVHAGTNCFFKAYMWHEKFNDLWSASIPQETLKGGAK